MSKLRLPEERRNLQEPTILGTSLLEGLASPMARVAPSHGASGQPRGHLQFDCETSAALRGEPGPRRRRGGRKVIT